MLRVLHVCFLNRYTSLWRLTFSLIRPGKSLHDNLPVSLGLTSSKLSFRALQTRNGLIFSPLSYSSCWFSWFTTRKNSLTQSYPTELNLSHYAGFNSTACLTAIQSYRRRLETFSSKCTSKVASKTHGHISDRAEKNNDNFLCRKHWQ